MSMGTDGIIEHMFDDRADRSSTTASPDPLDGIGGGRPMPASVRRLTDSTGALSDDALVDHSRRLAAAISAAEAELGAVLAEVERRGLHGSWDCSSVERFASWHCQLTPSRAAAIATLGRALTELPVVAEAVVGGQLPLSKSAPIIAVAAPDTESALVELATHATVSQTRRICAAWRRAERVERESHGEPGSGTGDGSEVPDDHPRVIVIRDHDGIELRARFDHVHGELVLASLDAAGAQVRLERAEASPIGTGRTTASSATASGATASGAQDAAGHRSQSTSGSSAVLRPASVDDIGRVRLTHEQWRAEGLMRLCETAAGTPPTSLQPSGFSAQVVVHVPVSTLIDPSMLSTRPPTATPTATPTVTSDSSCSIGQPSARPLGEVDILEPSGARIARDAARWLACDAGLLTVIDSDAGDPLHLGRRSSTITPQQRRAVHARFRTCAWPGCASTFVQVHHRHHRAFGGHDDIENLVPECRYHHALIHRRNITVTIDPDGTVHHRRPDGSEITASGSSSHHGVSPPGSPPPGSPPTVLAGDGLTTLERHQTEAGIDPSDRRRMPQWMGDPFQLAECIDAIFARRDAALRRLRPT
ncbi:MAG: HNH endonuclease [Actinobacteria bacterium]|nr:HNH endonuclease [Actinomycetota bacterium]